MTEKINEKEKQIKETLDMFWQTFPPIWHSARSLTKQIATEEFQITASQFHTLRRIAEGKNSVSALAECMHLSRPNLSRSVDELVTAGLVDRKRDENDRRNVFLSLSIEGQKLIKSLHERIGQEMSKKFNILTPTEIEGIQRGLSGLQKVFGRKERSIHQP